MANTNQGFIAIVVSVLRPEARIRQFFSIFYLKTLNSAHSNAYNSRSGHFWGDNDNNNNNDRRTKPITWPPLRMRMWGNNWVVQVEKGRYHKSLLTWSHSFEYLNFRHNYMLPSNFMWLEVRPYFSQCGLQLDTAITSDFQGYIFAMVRYCRCPPQRGVHWTSFHCYSRCHPIFISVNIIAHFFITLSSP